MTYSSAEVMKLQAKSGARKLSSKEPILVSSTIPHCLSAVNMLRKAREEIKCLVLNTCQVNCC